MPFALRGGVVEGLELRLAGGVFVESTPRAAQTSCAPSMDIDGARRRLGELALVDTSSRVGETGVVFKNTLFDENAAAHIAWGDGFSWTFGDRSVEDAHAAGINESERTWIHGRLARAGDRRRRRRRHGRADPA